MVTRESAVPTIVVETFLPQPSPIVWEELRHIDRHVRWMADARRIDFHSNQREGVGTTFDCLTTIGPFTTTDVMTVSEWRDGETMGVIHRGLFTGRGEFNLSPEGTGTRLRWRETLQFPWWYGGPVGAWLARPVLRLIWRKNLSNFARQLRDGPRGDARGD